MGGGRRARSRPLRSNGGISCTTSRAARCATQARYHRDVPLSFRGEQHQVRADLPGTVFVLKKTYWLRQLVRFHLPGRWSTSRPTCRRAPLRGARSTTTSRNLLRPLMQGSHVPQALLDKSSRPDSLGEQVVTDLVVGVGMLVEISAAGVTQASTLATVCGRDGALAPIDVLAVFCVHAPTTCRCSRRLGPPTPWPRLIRHFAPSLPTTSHPTQPRLRWPTGARRALRPPREASRNAPRRPSPPPHCSSRASAS